MNKQGKSKVTYYTMLATGCIVYIAFMVFVSAIVIKLVSQNGISPSGSDTMYHIYRGDYVYNSIKNGNWYPLYDYNWYNGVELMRYWAPLAAYVMAFCELLAGGDIIIGYFVFIGLICTLGAISWLYIGFRVKRPVLGAFIGFLWFFMPNNLYALFVEGNLARSLSMIFLPVFIYEVAEYIKDRKTGRIPVLMISFILIALCHLGYAGMVALAVLVYGVVHMIEGYSKRAVGDIVIAMLLSFMIIGIWMVASLNGGITSLDNSENMSNFFQSIVLSLNPIDRIKTENVHFYFGLAAALLAVSGMFFGYKRSRAGFVTAVITLICTTTAMYPVLKILPGSQYLWMLRFISIALCMILYSFLKWDTLRKPFIVLFSVLLIADIVPSMPLIMGNNVNISKDGIVYTGSDNDVDAWDRLDEQQEDTLIAKAQSVTTQRLALLDDSSLGSMGAFLISDWNNAVPAVYGAGREAANTSTNIVRVNRALADGNYYYVFDRCRELGSDTVLIRMSSIQKYGVSIDALDTAAKASGYTVVQANASYRLYNMDTYDNWGTVSSYDVIGIGSGTPLIAQSFPAVEETDSDNLNDYTYEQLSGYKEVILSGFTYDDKEAAENLVLRLSENGVRVVIYADGMPLDKKTQSQEFLGVTCNDIVFNNGYPDMDTKIGVLYPDLFPKGYATWNTVYLTGLSDVWGSVTDNGLKLDFYGTINNDNIVVCGLNLAYYYGVSGDKSVGRLISDMMDITPTQLPERTNVELDIKEDVNGIVITSDYDNVNTSLAYHDIFRSSQWLGKKNNLTYVKSGTTKITYAVPYLWQGALVSAAGIILSVVWMIMLKKDAKKRRIAEYLKDVELPEEKDKKHTELNKSDIDQNKSDTDKYDSGKQNVDESELEELELIDTDKN